MRSTQELEPWGDSAASSWGKKDVSFTYFSAPTFLYKPLIKTRHLSMSHVILSSLSLNPYKSTNSQVMYSSQTSLTYMFSWKSNEFVAAWYQSSRKRTCSPSYDQRSGTARLGEGGAAGVRGRRGGYTMRGPCKPSPFKPALWSCQRYVPGGSVTCKRIEWHCW